MPNEGHVNRAAEGMATATEVARLPENRSRSLVGLWPGRTGRLEPVPRPWRAWSEDGDGVEFGYDITGLALDSRAYVFGCFIGTDGKLYAVTVGRQSTQKMGESDKIVLQVTHAETEVSSTPNGGATHTLLSVEFDSEMYLAELGASILGRYDATGGVFLDWGIPTPGVPTVATTPYVGLSGSFHYVVCWLTSGVYSAASSAVTPTVGSANMIDKCPVITLENDSPFTADHWVIGRTKNFLVTGVDISGGNVTLTVPGNPIGVGETVNVLGVDAGWGTVLVDGGPFTTISGTDGGHVKYADASAAGTPSGAGGRVERLGYYYNIASIPLGSVSRPTYTDGTAGDDGGLSLLSPGGAAAPNTPSIDATAGPPAGTFRYSVCLIDSQGRYSSPSPVVTTPVLTTQLPVITLGTHVSGGTTDVKKWAVCRTVDSRALMYVAVELDIAVTSWRDIVSDSILQTGVAAPLPGADDPPPVSNNTAPSVTAMTKWKDRIWIAGYGPESFTGSVTLYSLLYCSNAASATQFSVIPAPDDPTLGTSFRVNECPIIALIPYGDYMLVMTQHACYVMMGNDSSDFRLTYQEATGCLSGRTVVDMGAGLVLFLSDKGPYSITPPVTLSPIGLEIIDKFRGFIPDGGV